MQKGLAKTLANPLQERKRQDSNLRTALGRSTVFEAASFSHSDTLPVISLGPCPKLSQFPHPPFQGGDQGLRAFHRRLPSLLASSGPASEDALLFYWDSVPNYLNSPDPLFKGAIRAYGLSIAAVLPCSPTPARHLMTYLILIPLTPFSRGHIRPSCAPELGAIASLFFGRHLMMPWFPKEFR